MRILAGFLFAAAAFGQISNVRVSGVTATQAILSYNSAPGTVCSIEVSPASSFAPLANDVDPVKFPGANLDSRAGAMASGAARTVVIGARRADAAADGKRYSRALAANTVHYFRVTCGAEQAIGNFQTANLALGRTYGEALPTDPSAPGSYAWPDLDLAGGAGTVDPLTGVSIQPLTRGNQDIFFNFPTTVVDAAGGPGWTNPANAIATAGAAAVYQGTASPQSWLYMRAGDAALQTLYAAPAWIQLTISAWSPAVNPADRTMQVCLTVNGQTCASAVREWTPCMGSSSAACSDSGSITQTVGTAGSSLSFWSGAANPPLTARDLTARTGTVLVSGPLITWMSGDPFDPNWQSGSRLQISGMNCQIAVVSNEQNLTVSSCAAQPGVQTYSAQNFGFLFRKKSSSNDPVSLDQVSWSAQAQTAFLGSDAGSSDLCSRQPSTDGVKQGYYCFFSTFGPYGGTKALYWVATDGESRYLGSLITDYNQTGLTRACDVPFSFPSDAADPDTFYCTAPDNSGNQVLMRARILSKTRQTALSFDTPIPPQNVQWTNLTPNSSVAILANAFNPAYNRTAFPNCRLMGSQKGNLLFTCQRNGQDSIAWTVVYSPASGAVIAAKRTWATAPARFCGDHSLLLSGDEDWALQETSRLSTPNLLPGNGGWNSVLAAPMLACTPGTNCTPCPSGSFGGVDGLMSCTDIVVDGEPCAAVNNSGDDTPCPNPGRGGEFLTQAAIEGDVFVIDSEYVQLVKKQSASNWTVRRGVNPFPGNEQSILGPHSAAAQIFTKCGVAAEYWWNYMADPNGTNSQGKTVYDDPQWYDSHPVFRAARGISPVFDPVNLPGGGNSGYSSRAGTLPQVFSGAATVSYINSEPDFSGQVGLSDTSSLEKHPSYQQQLAALPEQQWALDGRPYAASQNIPRNNGTDVTPVSGFLYKVSAAVLGSSWIFNQSFDAKRLPLAVTSGQAILRDVSSAATGNVITDTVADAYKYCVAYRAGECRTGSQPNEMYFNVPQLTLTYCSSSRFGTVNLRDICIASASMYFQGIAQFGIAASDPFGRNGRLLTNGLARYKDLLNSPYWNARPLPDASWMFWPAAVNGLNMQILMAKMPPYPALDSVSRNQFIPVPVQIGAANGATQARVRFGYAENGAPAQLFCTSRQESCVASSAAVNPASAFAYAGDTYSPLACASGCTIAVPAISQRILYYTVERLNAAGALVSTSALQAVAVP